MELRRIIKNAVREYLVEQNTIDTILDKINKVGIENLTQFEKDILSTARPKSELYEDTIEWLDKNYSNLNVVEDKIQSFGGEKEVIMFFDDEMEQVFEYDKYYDILYLSYEDIAKNMGEHLDENLFRSWFAKNYKINPKKISFFFTNTI
jgi:hypothetical protein